MTDPSSARLEAGRSRFVVNALASYGQRALVAVAALLVTPYLFRELGTDAFGTWSVMFTLTTVFAMLEEGFALGATKFVAGHRARERRGEVEKTLGATVVLMAGLGGVGMASCLALGLLAPGLASAGEGDAFRAGMIFLGGGILLRTPLVAYGSILAGYQRYDLYNAAQAVTIAGAALGSVAVVAAGRGVLGLAIVQAAALVAGGVTYLVLLRRLDPALRLRPLRGDRGARRQLLGFSAFTMLADSMMFIGGRLDTVVIAAIRSAGAATPFAVATKLQAGIQAVTLPVINLLVPMTSELEATGRRAVVATRLVVATRVTLQATIPVAAAMAMFSPDIVSLWLGSEAPAVTDEIVTLLALNSLMLCAVPAHKVLIGVGGARSAGTLNTVEGLLNLGVSVVLVSAYGAIGAAIGTLTASFAVGPANFLLVCRQTGSSLAGLGRAGIGGAVVSSLPCLAAMVPLWLLLSPGVGRLLLGFGAGLGVAAIVASLQLGPGRILTELRAGLRAARDPERQAPQLAGEEPV